MELKHEFTVHVPIADAWVILTDLARIAPCLPGAELTDVEGDIYRGHVKVKVGPIQAQFKGQASFMSRDDEAFTATLKAEGRDATGKGNAAALITAQLTSLSADTTKCAVNTDLTISGKVAQFGRGALADVSDKLLAQFSDNLNQLISSGVSESVTEVAPINLLQTAGAPIVKRAMPVVVAIVALVIVLSVIF
jgi:carbon monoxide dehydrogenase subunit G